MRLSFVTVLFVFFSLPSLAAQAADSNKPVPVANGAACITNWMAREQDLLDMADYKDFGEQYCSCINKNLPENQETRNRCLAQTLLHDTVQNLDEQQELSDAKIPDINTACQSRWDLIFPHMNSTVKNKATLYCHCVQKGLTLLFANSNEISEQQYTDHIDAIADSCAAQLAIQF